MQLLILATLLCGADMSDGGFAGVSNAHVVVKVGEEYGSAIRDRRILVAESGLALSVWEVRRGPDRTREDSWHFYRYVPPADTWEKTATWECGGFDFDSLRSLEWRSDEAGKDVLCETVSPYRAVFVEQEGIRILEEHPRFGPDAPDKRLVRWRSSSLPLSLGRDGVALDSAPRPVATLVQQTLGVLEQDEAGEGLRDNGLVVEDLALRKRRVVLTQGVYTRARLVNVEDGTIRLLAPGNDRLEFDYWIRAQFSFCERYLLMEYRYTGDSNHPVPAGVVQLFTSDGEFVTEVVEYGKEESRGLICGCARWLCDDWLVYTTPWTLVFAKIVDPAGTAGP